MRYRSFALSLRWFMHDLDLRSRTLARTLEQPLLDCGPQQPRRIRQLFERVIMNLVTTECVAARSDEQGVLVLSQFTGAARELPEALVINPYHIEQGAEALRRALIMPALVREFNVYRWTGRMLLDAARLRQHERVMSKIRSHSRAQLRRVV